MRSSVGRDDKLISELFGGRSYEHFLRDYWQQRHLHVQNPQTAPPTPWLSVEEVDRLLNETTPAAVDCRMAQGGSELPLSAYTTPSVRYDQSSHPVTSPQLVGELYAQGATLILENLHRYHAGLRRRVFHLSQTLNLPIKPNLFLTPPSQNAFPLHNDSYDSLIVQCEGQKDWSLYANAMKAPLRRQAFRPGASPPPLIKRLTLCPGDVLYIPRGLVHRCETADQLSLHLTLILRVQTPKDFLEALLDAPALSKEIDKEVKQAIDSDASEWLQSLTDKQIEGFAWDSLRRGALAQKPVSFAGNLTQPATFSSRSESVFSFREGTVISAERGSRYISVQCGTAELRLPETMETSLRALLGTKFTASDLHLCDADDLLERLFYTGLLIQSEAGSCEYYS